MNTAHIVGSRADVAPGIGAMTATGSGRELSAISWPAVLAGAFVAAGVTVILLALGSGLGFASVSPWGGMSAKTFTMATAVWLLVTQWLSAGMGGFVAGRLRSHWAGTPAHEVFFRDTAHGLVTWAAATVLVAVAATSVLGAAGRDVGTAAAAVTAAVPGAGEPASASGAGQPAAAGAAWYAYGIDKMFRPASPSQATGAGTTGLGTADGAAAARAEALRIVMHGATGMPDSDRTYLAQLIAAQAGVSPAEAQKRVEDWLAATEAARGKALAEADVARKTAAEAALCLALSLLVGAFIASVAAALGGRERDAY